MRLVFAKALLNKPKIILMDEPTLGLDPDMALSLRKEIKRINRKFGTTILMTSHYMQEVEYLADRIAFINNGKIIDIGTISGVKKSRFFNYDVIIELSDMKNKDNTVLSRAGFKIKGNKIYKTLPLSEDVGETLELLVKKGFKIKDIEIKKPSLEDYFIKMRSRG